MIKVDTHIRSFPFCVSHYAGHGNKRRYLSSELNITKMYTLLVQASYPEQHLLVQGGCDPKEVKCEIRYRFYYDYFRSHFNYGFGRPRPDVCCECSLFDAKIKVERCRATKRQLETNRRLHKQKAKMFSAKLKELSQIASDRDDTECICFDFKQNIPFPHLPTGDMFYSRQLWLFVFGIHSAKTGKGKMYTWPETQTQAKRGVYIRDNISDTVKTLYVFTDGCRGQNHNHTMVNYLQTLVLNGRFDKVVHRLPVRGHSFLPCDRNFGVIEK